MTDTGAKTFVDAFRRLALRQRPTLGGLQSGRHGDFVVVTAAAAVDRA